MDETSTEHKNTSKHSNRIGRLRGYNHDPYDTPIEICDEQSIDLLLHNFKGMSLDLATNSEDKQQPKTPPPAASPKFPGHLSNPRPSRVSSGTPLQPESADNNSQRKEQQPIDHQPAKQQPSSPPLEPQQRNDLRHDRSRTEMQPPSSSPLQPQQHGEQEHDHDRRQPELRPPSSRPLQSQQSAEEGNPCSQPEVQKNHIDEPEMQPPTSRSLPPQQREEQGPYQTQPEMPTLPSRPQLPQQDSERHNSYPPQTQQASSTSKSQRASSLPPPHPKQHQPRMQPPPPLHPYQSQWHHQDSERPGFPQFQMEQAPPLHELQAQQYEHSYRPAPYLPPVQPQGQQGHDHYQTNQPLQSPPLQPHQREEHRHNIGGQDPGSLAKVAQQYEHGYRPAPYLPPVQPQGQQGPEYYQPNQSLQSPPLQPHQREEHRHAPYNIGGQDLGPLAKEAQQYEHGYRPVPYLPPVQPQGRPKQGHEYHQVNHFQSPPPITPSAYPGSISSFRGHREPSNSSPAVMGKIFRTPPQAVPQPNSSHTVDNGASSNLEAVSARQEHNQEAAPHLINAERHSRAIAGKLAAGVSREIVWYQSRSDKQIARPPLLTQFHGPNVGEVYVHNYISEGEDTAQIWLYQSTALGWSDVSTAFLSGSRQISHPLSDTRILVRYRGKGFEPSYILPGSRRPNT